MFQIDSKYAEKKIVPIGFYEGNNIEAFITFNDVSCLSDLAYKRSYFENRTHGAID